MAVNTSMGSDFRYAGKYFKQKISSMSDMDSNNFWQDSSNIPVRIDGTSKNSNGEVNIVSENLPTKSQIEPMSWIIPAVPLL